MNSTWTSSKFNYNAEFRYIPKTRILTYDLATLPYKKPKLLELSVNCQHTLLELFWQIWIFSENCMVLKLLLTDEWEFDV